MNGFRALHWFSQLLLIALLVNAGSAQPPPSSLGDSLLTIPVGFGLQPHNPGLLVVRVVDSVTRSPRTDVDLRVLDGKRPWSSIYYPTARWLDEGIYRIELKRKFCSHWINDVWLARDSILWLEVPMGNPYVGVIKSLNEPTDIKVARTDMDVIPSGFAEGTVMNASGVPLVGAVVKFGRCSDSAITDTGGRYRARCNLWGRQVRFSVSYHQLGTLVTYVDRQSPADTVPINIYMSDIGEPGNSQINHSSTKSFVVTFQGWGGFVTHELRENGREIYGFRAKLGESFGPLAKEGGQSDPVFWYTHVGSHGEAYISLLKKSDVVSGAGFKDVVSEFLRVSCEPVELQSNTVCAGWTYTVHLNCER